MAGFKVAGDTPVEEVLARKPATAGTFIKLGLPCFVCGEPTWGTVAELCTKHKKDLATVLDALNSAPDK